MRFRPLFALLTSVAMLHLSVVAGDAACATHDANGHHAAKASATRAVQMNGHAMPVAQDAHTPAMSALPAAVSDTPPCEVPTQARCCQALLGCSVDGAVTSAHEAMVATASPAARIRVAPDDVPTSFAPAPEPPPPKA